MKESPIYQDIIQEGIMQGVAQGLVQAKRDDILKFLIARFDEVPEEVARAIGSVEETEELDRLIRLAARCQSIEEFSAQVVGATVA